MIMIIFILPAILLLFEKVIIKTSKGFIEPKKDNEQGNPVFAGKINLFHNRGLKDNNKRNRK
ncbi:MAG: hypothetical protein ACLTDP_01240 [Terrisporobacter sp.]